MSNRNSGRHRRQRGAPKLAGFGGAALVAAADPQRGVMTKAGAFAAGTALAGAAVFGGTVVAQSHPAGLFSQVQPDVALTALGDPLGTGDTFADAVQNSLAALKLGNIGQLLGLLGQNDDGVALYDAATPLFVAADKAPDGVQGGLLTALTTFDGKVLTMNGMTDLFGLSLTQPLWAATGDSVLGAGSDIVMDNAAGVATPIGDLSLNDLIGNFLGGDVATATIQKLFDGLGMGPLAGFVTVLCDPGAAICTPDLLGDGVGTLTTNDTVSDLFGSLLNVNTATTSLGEYLQGIELGHGLNLAGQSLGDLTGLTPAETVAEFLSKLTLGGGTILNPLPTVELGELTLGGLLGALAGDSTGAITDGTLTGDWLMDLGLFG